jgi:uncharacterized repeat protein (TIGR01451 family)
MSKNRLLIILVALCTLVGSGAVASITTPLSIYSSNRHYFVNNGSPVVIIGAGQPLPGHKIDDYRAYLDDMAAHKVNYGRVWHLLPWDSKNAYFPWARDAGGTANDGLAKFNLTHWDSNFWSRMKDACAYAQSKNIYLSIMLFDECGIEAEHSSTAYRYHPFHPSNNVNNVGLPSDDAVPEFYNLSNGTLKSLQELYVSKMIQETSGYQNVIYEICNEYTGGWDWEKYWIGYVSARCSNMVTVNRLTSEPSDYWSDPSIDMVKYHWGTTSAGTVNSKMLSYYSKNKPVNYDETPELSTITYTNYRNMVWAAFVGGGHIHLENGENAGAGLDAVLYLSNFIQSNGVRFWEMSPNNGLVTSAPGGSAYTLAKAGSEYVTYVTGSGGGSMNINLASGATYAAKAYNPSNGTYADLRVSGNTVSGIPSYSSDIVIYVKKAETAPPPTTGTPTISLALTASNTAVGPGDEVTYTITYKNNGDGNAASVSISCPVPQNMTYVSATSGGTYDSAARMVKWTISSVSPGASGMLTYKIKID